MKFTKTLVCQFALALLVIIATCVVANPVEFQKKSNVVATKQQTVTKSEVKSQTTEKKTEAKGTKAEVAGGSKKVTETKVSVVKGPVKVAPPEKKPLVIYNHVPVKMGFPAQNKPAQPAQKKPASPAQKKPGPPAQKKPGPPAQKKPGPPAKMPKKTVQGKRKPAKGRKQGKQKKKPGQPKRGNDKVCKPNKNTAVLMNVDTSGSMGKQSLRRIKKIIEAVSTLVKDIKLGIMTWGTTSTLACAPIKDMRKFKECIESSKYHGSTSNCGSAVANGSEVLNNVHDCENKFLFTFSDEQCSNKIPLEIIKKSDSSNITRATMLSGRKRAKTCQYASSPKLCFNMNYRNSARVVAQKIVSVICAQGKKNKN